MSEINYEDYRDLLVVSTCGETYMVEAPAHEVNVSDMVVFDQKNGFNLVGIVVDKTWCNRTESEYRCIKQVIHIYQAKKVFRERWSADPEKP